MAIELPVLPALEEIIAAIPCHAVRLAVHVQRLRELVPPPLLRSGAGQYSAHGLRKAGAVRAAENGATKHELMAIFGWRAVKEAERYTQAAAQAPRQRPGASPRTPRTGRKIPTLASGVVPTVPEILIFKENSR